MRDPPVGGRPVVLAGSSGSAVVRARRARSRPGRSGTRRSRRGRRRPSAPGQVHALTRPLIAGPGPVQYRGNLPSTGPVRSYRPRRIISNEQSPPRCPRSTPRRLNGATSAGSSAGSLTKTNSATGVDQGGAGGAVDDRGSRPGRRDPGDLATSPLDPHVQSLACRSAPVTRHDLASARPRELDVISPRDRCHCGRVPRDLNPHGVRGGTCTLTTRLALDAA